MFRALPEIKKYADTDNLTHLYEENNDPLFCKSKVLNDLIVAAKTKVVANYDADCILPITSYQKAYTAINDDQSVMLCIHTDAESISGRQTLV